MARRSVREELLWNLERLSPEKQRELLDYARSLTEAAIPTNGTPGKDLAVFGGAIETSDLAKIARSIEEDCEQVDRGAWLRHGMRLIT
jgi:hypothetical protein